MGLEIGAVLEGKVTGITKFGAFVALPEGKSGLVHISEIANSYVSDVAEHVQMGQAVKVKVINISGDGKINLSIKKAEAPEPGRERRSPQWQKRPPSERREAPTPRQAAASQSGNQDFEDRLKKFMQESDSRIADNRIYSEHRQRGRRR